MRLPAMDEVPTAEMPLIADAAPPPTAIDLTFSPEMLEAEKPVPVMVLAGETAMPVVTAGALQEDAGLVMRGETPTKPPAMVETAVSE